MTRNRNFIAGRGPILGLFTATALAACSGDDASLSPSSLPLGAVGAPYEVTVTANDFDETPSWSIALGDLPPGLDGTANGSSWQIAGTPVTPGSFQFVLRAEGGEDVVEGLYRIVIGGGEEPLEIITTQLPEGTEGLAYQALVSATGGSRSGYVWSQSGLPAGLDFVRIGATTAQVSGTPESASESSVIFTVTDDAMNTATATLTLTINSAAESLEITTETIPAAIRGVPYEGSITAQGGSNAGYTWAADILPPGLVIQDGTPRATIVGTPTQEEAGQFAINVTVTDSEGASAERSLTFTVRDPDDLVISPKVFMDGAVGQPYSETLNAVGGVAPFAWSISAGTPPAGTTVDASTTRTTNFSGTPTEAGTFSFTIQIADELGATAELPVELFVLPETLEIVPGTPAVGDAGAAYATTFQATGGAAPFEWSVAVGELPPGLTLGASITDSVDVTGIPLRGGTFDATLAIEDSLGATAEQAFTFVINAAPNPLQITTTALADATVGQAYIENVAATGGTGIDYAWRVVSGALPDGLELMPDGTPSTLLFGIPTVAGDFVFTVEVQDSAGSMAQVPFSMTSTTAN